MRKSIKPPLGIEPEWAWIENRYIAVTGAIHRYTLAGHAAPPEWYSERDKLREYIQQRNDEE